MALFNTYDNPFTTYEAVQPVTSNLTSITSDINDNRLALLNLAVASKNSSTTDSASSKWYEKLSSSDNSSIEDNSVSNNDMVNFFKEKGLTTNLAKGIVGNIMLESGGNSDIIEGGKRGLMVAGKGYGLALWTNKSRQQGLANLAKSLGTSVSDKNTLLEYIWLELNTTERNALAKIKAANTVEEATRAAMAYERPAASAANLRNRIYQALKA